jgi:hypothetical protein
VLFSLFRTYVELSSKPGWNPKTDSERPPNYLILFEEPELYLHPQAQQVLFDSLAHVASDFQVLVTTHSPLFFSPTKTKTFAKLFKVSQVNGAAPFSRLVSVDLDRDLDARDEFQILCYENNNVAFFANRVLLVEGESDVAALKHLASTINPAWDFDKGKVRMVKVGGKGSFARYAEFFRRFQIGVLVLADLDALLGQFDKLQEAVCLPPPARRQTLLEMVCKRVPPPESNRTDAKGTWKDRGQRVIQIISLFLEGGTVSRQDVVFLEETRDELGPGRQKLEVLKTDPSVQEEKKQLFMELRQGGLMILERGSLEDYYPDDVHGQDKPSKAQDFRKKVTTPEACLALCSVVPVSAGGTRKEFEAIFARVFDGSDALRQQ